MELNLYWLLGTDSKRSMARLYDQKKLPDGQMIPINHHYKPRRKLLNRLSEITGKSPDECRDILLKERQYILEKTNPGIEIKPSNI